MQTDKQKALWYVLASAAAMGRLGAPPVAPYVRLSPPGETARSLSPTATLRALSSRCALSTWLRKRTGEPPTGSCLTGHLTSEFSESEKTVRRKQRGRRRARRRPKAATSSALESRASTSQDPERLRSWWTNKRYHRYRATFGVSDILSGSYVKLPSLPDFVRCGSGTSSINI